MNIEDINYYLRTGQLSDYMTIDEKEHIDFIMIEEMKNKC